MNKLIVIVIAAVLSACLSVGARYDQASIRKIKPGATTEGQLTQWFGKPYRHESLPGNREKLTWQYTKAGVAVGIVEQHELFVTMSADRKVESFEERNR